MDEPEPSPFRGLGVAVAVGGVAFLGLSWWLTRQQQAAPQPLPTPSPTPTPGCVPLTLTASGPGSVSGCGGQAHQSSAQLCLPPGQQCQFSAWPDQGAVFAGWTGPGGASGANPLTLPISTPGSLSGSFRESGPCPPGQVVIALSVNGPGTASGCGARARDGQPDNACAAPGEQCVFTASSDLFHQFLHWKGPNGIQSTDNPLTLPLWGDGFLEADFS